MTIRERIEAEHKAGMTPIDWRPFESGGTERYMPLMWAELCFGQAPGFVLIPDDEWAV